MKKTYIVIGILISISFANIVLAQGPPITGDKPVSSSELIEAESNINDLIMEYEQYEKSRVCAGTG